MKQAPEMVAVPLRLIPVTAAFTGFATPVLAHPGHAAHTLAAGFLHPLSGMDHIAAMVAVGLWAAFLGGRALWAVPSSFVAAMIAGFVFGMDGLTLPAIEPGIAASIVILGSLTAAAVRMRPIPSMALVGLFGFLHGQAHGVELEGAAWAFGTGFVVATILLHGAGIAVGSAFGRRQRIVMRALGVAIAGGGLLLYAGAA